MTRLLLRFRPLIGLLLATIAISTAGAQPRANPPPGKSADTSERDQRARDRFQQGRQAYEDGRYRDAWAYFHEAYQLSGRPELLYNIGQTADRLGQDADALKAFNMYLERLPNAENRHDVENRVRALRERVNQPSPTPPARTATAAPVEPTPVAPVAAPHKPAREVAHEAAPPPPPTEKADKAHRHGPRHGLYVRGALGFGYRYDGLSGNQGGDGSLYGVGLSLDLGVGYAVLPGFVVGGMLFLDQTFRPTASGGGVDFKMSHANLWTFGPFVDWYPKRETAGWHIQGALGIGVLGYGGNEVATASASGLDIIIGGGYEWTLSGAYAIGILARFTLGLLSEDEGSHGWVSPNIAVSFTWF